MSDTPSNERIPWAHVAPLGRWTVPAVLAILSSFEDGDFSEAAMLADAMLRDPQIAGDLGARVRALASRSALPFSVDPSEEGDGRKRQAVADAMKPLWWSAHPESTIAAIDRDAIILAASVGWIEWLKDARSWVPRLHQLPAHGLRFQDYDKTFHYQGGDGIDHLVTPGDGKWFLHLPHGPRSWMMGALRPLAIPFALDPLTLQAFAAFCKRHGMPALGVKEPHRSTDNVENGGAAEASASAKENVNAFYREILKGLENGVIRLPRGDTPEGDWDAKWLEATSKSYTSFTDLLVELRRRKALALTGRDSEKQTALGGDGEDADAQKRFEGLSYDAESLTTSLRECVWKPWARFNHGDEKLAPWGRWQTRPQKDLSGRVTTLDKAGDALDKLESQGVDTDPLVTELGLKRRAGWKPPDTNAPPPVPAKADDPKAEKPATPADEDT